MHNSGNRVLIFMSFNILMVLFSSAAQALISPTSQAEAAYWLRIEVTQVAHESGLLEARAKVLDVFRSDSDLKAGAKIEISYPLEPVPENPAERRLGPGSTPPLREKSTVYAFLNLNADGKTFEPGAGVWSFAPPFGIPENTRESLGMSLPTPPASPPPPPPPNMPRPRADSPAIPVAPPPPPPPPPPAQQP